MLGDNQSIADDNASKGSKDDKPSSKNTSLDDKKFDLELIRLHKARGIPDGKSARFGEQSERQRRGREKKANEARGFIPGGTFS